MRFLISGIVWETLTLTLPTQRVVDADDAVDALVAIAVEHDTPILSAEVQPYHAVQSSRGPTPRLRIMEDWPDYLVPHPGRRSTAMEEANEDDDEELYTIVRFHAHRARETLLTGQTLDEAKAHCNSPESSSTTASSAMAAEYTAKYGPWFDGFQKES